MSTHEITANTESEHSLKMQLAYPTNTLPYPIKTIAEQREAEIERELFGTKPIHNNLDGIIMYTDELTEWRGMLRVHAMQAKSPYEANTKLEDIDRRGYSKRQVFKLRCYYYRKAIESLEQAKNKARDGTIKITNRN
jgi:hypothetical protein